MNDEEREKEHNFQKKLAKLQIVASAVITIGAILIALGFTIIVTQNPSTTLYPWNGLAFLGFGIALMLYHLFGIKDQINKLE